MNTLNRMTLSCAVSLGALLAGASPAFAQGDEELILQVEMARAPKIDKPKVELSANPTAARTIWSQVETIRMPAVDVAWLIAEDIANRDEPGPKRVGVAQDIFPMVATDRAGAWSQEADGGWVWRCRFVQPGAEASRLHLDYYKLPAGGQLIIGEPTGRFAKAFGPEQEMPDGSMWTPPVPGDTILLELHVPEATAQSPIRIAEMVHIYDPSFGWPEVEPEEIGDLYRGVVGCHIDAMCQSFLNVQEGGIGRMLYDSGGSSYVCTGSLLNDADSSSLVPYFLTAHHCLSTQSEASSLNVTWFYRSNSCNGSVPSPGSLPQSDGAFLLVTNPSDATGSDRTLLQIFEPLSDGQSLLGWTTGGLAFGEDAWGLHHPGGSHLRWSKGPIDSTPLLCTGLPASNYWLGNWTDGTTEGGSSGSPLFNSAGHVVGQLFGGCVPEGADRCADRPLWNYAYGKLSHDFHEIDPFIYSSGKWIDLGGGIPLFENGSPALPFDTLAEGVSSVPTGGRLYIYTSSTSETPTISKAMTINAYNGPVTIGN